MRNSKTLEFLNSFKNEFGKKSLNESETLGDLLDEIKDALSISDIYLISERIKDKLNKKMVQDEIDSIEQEYDIDNIDEDSEEYADILNELKSCIFSDLSGEENEINEGCEKRN